MYVKQMYNVSQTLKMEYQIVKNLFSRKQIVLTVVMIKRIKKK